jgi:transposase
MLVIGADTHKRSHTLAAVEAASGRMLAELTVPARRRCFEALLARARGHGNERVWAIEDCRHVSGALERFLLAHGEAVVRVAPKLSVRERSAARERGKSDAIDAVAIARAALREGLDTLPVAQLAGPELDVRLLVDHRERLIAQRTALSNDPRWHLYDLWPETAIALRALTATSWQTRIAARLGRAPQTARVRIARDQLPRAINDRHAEPGTLVAALAPRLLAERGCGVLTAAKLLGEIADVTRFTSDAKLARSSGTAPIPASSGRTQRHRLDRGGNRQLNCALHRLAITKGRLDPETAAYLTRRQAEGKTRREAIRCLKRYLARRVWHLLQPDPETTIPTSTPSRPKRTITIHCNRPIGSLQLT